MAHNLSAFITKEKNLSPFVRRAQLPQGFALVPGDEWLLSQFPELEGRGTRGFSELLCGGAPVAAVFTDYFGGDGEQRAETSDGALYEDNSDVPLPINRALEDLGVLRDEGLDEFDTLGLDEFRSTEEVLGQPRDLAAITEDEVRALWDQVLFSRDATGVFSHFYPYGESRDPGITIYRGSGPMYPPPFHIDKSGHFYVHGDDVTNRLEAIMEKMSEAVLKLSPDDKDALDFRDKKEVKDQVLGDVDRRTREFLSRRNFYITNTNTNGEGKANA
jgi:hypothetical protein